jgi:hypothetical protein
MWKDENGYCPCRRRGCQGARRRRNEPSRARRLLSLLHLRDLRRLDLLQLLRPLPLSFLPRVAHPERYHVDQIPRAGGPRPRPSEVHARRTGRHPGFAREGGLAVVRRKKSQSIAVFAAGRHQEVAYPQSIDYHPLAVLMLYDRVLFVLLLWHGRKARKTDLSGHWILFDQSTRLFMGRRTHVEWHIMQAQ